MVARSNQHSNKRLVRTHDGTWAPGMIANTTYARTHAIHTRNEKAVSRTYDGTSAQEKIHRLTSRGFRGARARDAAALLRERPRCRFIRLHGHEPSRASISQIPNEETGTKGSKVGRVSRGRPRGRCRSGRSRQSGGRKRRVLGSGRLRRRKRRPPTTTKTTSRLCCALADGEDQPEAESSRAEACGAERRAKTGPRKRGDQGTDEDSTVVVQLFTTPSSHRHVVPTGGAP